MATKDEALGLAEGTTEIKPSVGNRLEVHAHLLYAMLADETLRLAATSWLEQNLPRLANAAHSHYCEELLKQIQVGDYPSSLLE